jgi:hypothetical protein
MAKSDVSYRGRQGGRRETLREGIPNHVSLPKFMTTAEIQAVKQLHEATPGITWEEAVSAIIKQNSKSRAG